MRCDLTVEMADSEPSSLAHREQEADGRQIREIIPWV